jgi:transaldolase
VHVKLPVTTTRGEPLFNAVRALSHDGIKINLTASPPSRRLAASKRWREAHPPRVSVFAGHRADAGIDYRSIMGDAIGRAIPPIVEIIWASTREVFNVIEANEMRCQQHNSSAPITVSAVRRWRTA